MMPWLPTPTGRLAGRAALSVGSGSAGWLGALAAAHRPGAAVAAAAAIGAAAITSSLAKITESIFKHRSGIVKAKGEAKALVIKARSEAKALSTRTETQTALLQAGMDPAQDERAVMMLRQQAINVDLPEDRRLPHETLAKLLTPKPRSTGTKPGSGPRGVVVPIRPDD